MNYREYYPLSVWLDDVAEIIKRRDFVGKKEALQLVVNDIEELLSGDVPRRAASTSCL